MPGRSENDTHNTEDERDCPIVWGWVVVNGRRVRKRCGSANCSVCGPMKARATAHVIEKARPSLVLGVHNFSADWQDRRRAVNELGRRVRQSVAPAEFEWCWVTHENEDLDHPGHHLHALARTDQGVEDIEEFVMARFLDEAMLVDPEPYAEPVRNVRAVSAYLLRKAFGGEHERHLAENGGRFVHASAGFFAGGLVGALDQERADRWNRALIGFHDVYVHQTGGARPDPAAFLQELDS